MLLSYNQLMSKVIGGGCIRNVDPDNVNGSSIDIRLGDTVMEEAHPTPLCPSCGYDVGEQGQFDLKSRRDRDHSLVRCPRCQERSPYGAFFTPIDITKKEPLKMTEISLKDKDFILGPGEAILAQSMEIFYLPANITAEYRLKSSMARCFLEHLHAGWCDPMWQGSVLTLELVNMSKYHSLVLKAGMKIGQMCFYSHDPVPQDKSYAVRGQYNNNQKVTPSQGLK